MAVRIFKGNTRSLVKDIVSDNKKWLNLSDGTNQPLLQAAIFKVISSKSETYVHYDLGQTTT